MYKQRYLPLGLTSNVDSLNFNMLSRKSLKKLDKKTWQSWNFFEISPELFLEIWSNYNGDKTVDGDKKLSPTSTCHQSDWLWSVDRHRWANNLLKRGSITGWLSSGLF